MNRILVASVLAGFALAASAALRAAPAQFDTLVPTREACPPGTVASTPSYTRQDGHWVLSGWVCTPLYSGS
jgi:hypothetical protein